MIREDDEHPGHVDWLHLDRLRPPNCGSNSVSARSTHVGATTWAIRSSRSGSNTIRSSEELTAATLAHREAHQQLNKNPYHGGMAAWHYQVLWPLVHRIPTIAGFDDCRSWVCGYGPDEPEIADDSPSSSLPAPTAAPNLNPQKRIGLVYERADDGSGSRNDRQRPEGPSDDFTAFDIDDVRWEFVDDSETYRPVE